MKLSTAHTRDQSWHDPYAEICHQCGVPWPCDAAIACEEVETLNRIIARYRNGWHPVEPVDDEPGLWVGERGWHEEPPEEIMSDAEWEALRPHLETP